MIPTLTYDRFKQFREAIIGVGKTINGSIPNSGNLPNITPTSNAKPTSSLPMGGSLPYSALLSVTPKVVNTAKAINFVSNNKPAIRAATGLASELITANRLDDNVETQTVQNKPFVYKNRTGFLADKNRANFRNFLRSRTGMPINANQAYASTLNADNQVAAMEGERQDKAVESYNNRDLQINATNTEAFNRNLYLNNMLKNNKIVQKGSAFTNYLSNLDTQDAQASALARDKKALELMGLALKYGRTDGLLNVTNQLPK